MLTKTPRRYDTSIILILLLLMAIYGFFLWDMATTDNNRLNNLQPTSIDMRYADYIHVEVYDEGYDIAVEKTQ